MELVPFLKLLLRWSWLVAAVAILGGVLGILEARATAPVYAASATFFVSSRSNLPPSDQERVMETYAELAMSRPILTAVVDQLPFETTVEALQRQMGVNANGATLMVTVAVEDINPQHAAIIANEVVRVLDEDGRSLVRMDTATSRASLQVLEAAQVPTDPIRPRTTLNAALGVIVGGGLAVVLIVGIALLDTTLRTAEEVAQVTGNPPLVAVPFSPASVNPARFQSATMNTPFVEAYRLLRTHLDYAAEETPIRTIAVTSASNGEGKTVVAAFLAMVLALSGRRVILVDANMQVPRLHKLFETDEGCGLSDVLSQQHLDEADLPLRSTSVPLLRLMTAGPPVAHPAELLASQQMKDLVRHLQQQADIVVFDTPGLLAVVDGTVIARMSDVTLYVSRSGATQKGAFAKGLTQLNQFGVVPLGTVLNSVPLAQSSFTRSRRRKITDTAIGRLNRIDAALRQRILGNSDKDDDEQDTNQQSAAIRIEGRNVLPPTAKEPE